jgi:hypothetical protein
MNLPMILFQGRFDPSQISIKHSPSTRKTTEELKERISTNWTRTLEEAKSKGIKIWDSVNYRLNDFNLSRENLELNLGEITFKTRVGLRESKTLFKTSVQITTQKVFTYPH